MAIKTAKENNRTVKLIFLHKKQLSMCQNVYSYFMLYVHSVYVVSYLMVQNFDKGNNMIKGSQGSGNI